MMIVMRPVTFVVGALCVAGTAAMEEQKQQKDPSDSKGSSDEALVDAFAQHLTGKIGNSGLDNILRYIVAGSAEKKDMTVLLRKMGAGWHGRHIQDIAEHDDADLVIRKMYRDLLEAAQDHTLGKLNAFKENYSSDMMKYATLNAKYDTPIFGDGYAYGKTALHLAAGHQPGGQHRAEVVRALLKDLDAGTIRDLLCATAGFSTTPLHIAAEYGSHEVVEALLEKLDPDQINEVLRQQDDAGRTPPIGIAKAFLENLDR